MDVASALTTTSLRGVDSHGIRLLPHYVKVLEGGRVNGDPTLEVTRRGTASAVVDADNGFGHHASYRAVDEACHLAVDSGVAMVGVVNSSHFGAAGCYVLEAARRGFTGLAVCNTDSLVLPHDGVDRFHGTNPLAFSAPVPGGDPYLLDMATSITPWNRVHQYRAEGRELPMDVAVDADGTMTTDPHRASGLLPIGGQEHGHKGAGLAGMVDILSAVLTGMPHSAQLLDMSGPDISTPRRLGHLFIVTRTDALVEQGEYERGMTGYLAALRSSRPRAGRTVMAPGDREWSTQAERANAGIPVPPALFAELLAVATRLGVDTHHLTDEGTT